MANATADAFANRAAELAQLSERDLGAIKARSELSTCILRRLVAIAIKLTPASTVGSRVIQVAGKTDETNKFGRPLGQEVGPCL